ncbi:hypothetical protein Droror1_Dr00002692 [Drosera rotundifolia]
MKRPTISAAEVDTCAARITRARAKSFENFARGQIEKPPIQDQKRFRAHSKRAASNENKQYDSTAPLQIKRKAVLTDVTNVSNGTSNASKVDCDNLRKNVKAIPRVPKAIKPNKLLKRNVAKTVSKMTNEEHRTVSYRKGDILNETSKLPQAQNLKLKVKSAEALLIPCQGGNAGVTSPMLAWKSSFKPSLLDLLKKHPKHHARSEISKASGIVDINPDQKDPQACSQYVDDIYDHKRAAELNQRPWTEYMDTVQRDVTESMRGILIDWLVEVSEEYALVPDTLYLTVNLIDRFLSQNYIEKQRLQLLGVTCMLMASKYEEICAPRVEELCFITDNTYTKDEILKMENQVLTFLRYQLSVPTTKTFLRRFVKAAQATSKAPSLDLEYLANYLAELTLIEYRFLKYLPSLIAASAVFLARWTLDQSSHPWNPTLEYYTCYAPQDLKSLVPAMQELQLNSNTCPLKAIREKYKQQKFNCVANLSSPKTDESLF